jgi:hypothetical protein
MQAARSLTRTLAYWRERIKYAQLANEFDLLLQSGALERADADRLQDLRQRNPRLVGPGWDRHWNTLFAEWEEKRTKLSGLLLEAAELYDSGQTGGDVFPLPTLENAKRRAGVEGLAAAKYSGWGGAETLRAIGRVIDETPVEVLFPAARPRPLGWAPGQVGKHGGASSPEGALNGMVVREIAHRVPANCAEWKGFTAISRLAKFLGLEKCTPEYVRSSLSRSAGPDRRGKTFRGAMPAFLFTPCRMQKLASGETRGQTMHDKSLDYLGSTREGAEYVGNSERAWIRWRGQGKGPAYVRVGGQIRYRKRDIDAWLAKHRVVPVREEL